MLSETTTIIYYVYVQGSFENVYRALLRICGALLHVYLVRDYYRGAYYACIQGSFDNMRRAVWRIYTQGSFENICMALLRVYRALLYMYVVRDYYKVSYYVCIQALFIIYTGFFEEYVGLFCMCML